jgi:hypothetical protein
MGMLNQKKKKTYTHNNPPPTHTHKRRMNEVFMEIIENGAEKIIFKKG